VVSFKELSDYIKEYIQLKAPGFYTLLDIAVFSRMRKHVEEAIFEDPVKVYRLLSNHYGNEDSALFVLTHFLIRPITIKLGKVDLEPELIKLATTDSSAFKEFISKLLLSTSQNK